MPVDLLLQKFLIVPGKTLPVIVIPSTAGTGAEMTVGAVADVSSSQTDIEKSRQCVRLVLENLPLLKEHPENIDARAAMCLAANLGGGNAAEQRYTPTIIYPVGADEGIVYSELFCPLLPVVPFKDGEVDAILDVIENREHPLAMYFFTKNIRWAERVMRSVQYGGGCINEVCVHMMVKGVPFGGLGHSGMGAYHGEWGFREFTHASTVLKGSTRLNLSLREHPYREKKILPLLRLLEK